MLARSSWLEDYLHDPAGAVLALLVQLREWACANAPVGLSALAAIAGGLVLARNWRNPRVHARLTADARQITVLAPPTVDPAGGQALWSNLVGLLRPPLRRWFAGQPHLACEYVFSDAGVAIRLWVPGVIPPGLVERAVEAAWPGAHTRTEP